MPELPQPASFENIPRATPNRSAAKLNIPISPATPAPGAVSGKNADLTISAITSGSIPANGSIMHSDNTAYPTVKNGISRTVTSEIPLMPNTVTASIKMPIVAPVASFGISNAPAIPSAAALVWITQPSANESTASTAAYSFGRAPIAQPVTYVVKRPAVI